MTSGVSNTPKLIIAIAIIGILLLMIGCEKRMPDKEVSKQVRQVMELRQKAIETKDIELYKQAFYTGYSDRGVNINGLVEEMQHIFDTYKKIEFTFQRSTVDMDMNSARMVGQVSYLATGMDKPVYYQERTIFRRIEGKWMISAGVKTGVL